MSTTIRKYPLLPQHRNDILLPLGANILCTQEQHGEVTLWAMVNSDPSVSLAVRTFTTYYTGVEMPDDPGTYIGTVQLHNGATVIHVFEELAQQ